MIRIFFLKYFELTFWVAALIALGFCDPSAQKHFVLCPFKLMGFNWCPGCGLGHSIAFLLHGDIRSSWHAHWLGVPALIIIVYRIVELVRMNFGQRRGPFLNIEHRISNTE